MATFRSPFVRKDATRGSRPLDGRLSLAGLLTPSSVLGALPGVISGLTVSGIASTWAYAVSAGHAVTKRSDADGANTPGLDGVTNTPTVAAAPASGSRWDLIWIRQQDVDNADADSSSLLGVTSGAASGTPSKRYDLVPAGALVLAEAQVFTGATGTLHANVVITQVAARVSTRGGIIPVTTQAQLDALAAVASVANPIYVDYTGTLERNSGSGWVVAAAQTDLSSPVALVPAAPWGAPTGAQLPAVVIASGLGVLYGGRVELKSGSVTFTTGVDVLVGNLPSRRPSIVVETPCELHYGTGTPQLARAQIGLGGDLLVRSTTTATMTAGSSSLIVLPPLIWPLA